MKWGYTINLISLNFTNLQQKHLKGLENYKIFISLFLAISLPNKICEILNVCEVNQAILSFYILYIQMFSEALSGHLRQVRRDQPGGREDLLQPGCQPQRR